VIRQLLVLLSLNLVAGVSVASASDRVAFTDLHSAAKAALTLAIVSTDGTEYGGAIYQCDGMFGFSKPRSSGSDYAINVRVKVPSNCALAGIYHTHPKGFLSERFSPDDLLVVCTMRLPSFIQTPGDDARVLEPTRRACRDLARAQRGLRDAAVLRGVGLGAARLVNL
jgi:hypothetical protein